MKSIRWKPRRYHGPVPPDLHYVRVAHHFLGPATVTPEGGSPK